jgi:hypothetical protein
MGSLVDELQRRKAAARAEAEQLRGQIARLLERLAGVEAQLWRPRRARTGSRGQRIALEWLGAARESRAGT